MATGSLDKTIKIWLLDKGKCEMTLTGHKRGVWCVKFITQYLLCSGSYDCSIKIWNLKQGTCTRTLFSHTGPIWCFCKNENILVSGSQDKTARVWDMSNCSCLFVLTSHKEAVFCVDIYDKLICTGSGDRTVKLWNRISGVLLKTIHTNESMSVMGISLFKDYFACSYNQSLQIWKIEKAPNGLQCIKIKEYKEHLKRIECVSIKVSNKDQNDVMVTSASQDGFIKYWKMDR